MDNATIHSSYRGDLPEAVKRAIRAGAAMPHNEPILTLVLPGGDSLTVQKGGDLAIYRAIGFDFYLFACGCQGEIVNEIPRKADQLIAFKLLGEIHRIYRYQDIYYDFPGEGNHYIQFKAYTDTTIAGGNDDDKPFDPPPGLDNPCSTHDYPPLIPDEYNDVVRRETPEPFQKDPQRRDQDPHPRGAISAGFTPAIEAVEDDKTCDNAHTYPALIPKEYREVTERDDLVKDQRKPRDRDKC